MKNNLTCLLARRPLILETTSFWDYEYFVIPSYFSTKF